MSERSEALRDFKMAVGVSGAGARHDDGPVAPASRPGSTGRLKAAVGSVSRSGAAAVARGLAEAL